LIPQVPLRLSPTLLLPPPPPLLLLLLLQALQFLVLHHKGSLSLDELSAQVCKKYTKKCTSRWRKQSPADTSCISLNNKLCYFVSYF
jgi:hypothetical protein